MSKVLLTMALWLFKQEPQEFSYSQLEEAGKALWDGVSNSLALKHLRSIKVGDRAFFYHTGKEKAIVGEMKVIAGPSQNPKEKDPKLVVVEVKPVKRYKVPVTLETIKEDKVFAGWELIRIPRLSVMPVSQQMWDRIEALGRKLV